MKKSARKVQLRRVTLYRLDPIRGGFPTWPTYTQEPGEEETTDCTDSRIGLCNYTPATK